MPSKPLLALTLAGVALAATGCDKIKSTLSGKPSGQVVATVNGEEITSLELRNELGGFSSRDPKIMKQAQDQALQQIIIRDLLAQKAKAQKMDKVPQYSLQVRRGERTLLAQMYEGKLFGNVAPPTRKEAENYIVNNPDKFANRRIFVLARVVAPADRIPKENVPSIKTMDELKAFLDARSIPYQETATVVDTLNAEPEAIRGMEKLPPGEVFVFQSGNAFVFNNIVQTRSAPFRGELAVQFATDQLRRAQAQDFVQTQIVGLRRAAESSITYAKGYKPDNPDLGVAPVTGGPGAQPEAQPSGGVPAVPPSSPAPAAAPAAPPAK
jgi:EpsD family peptidyl-prolyl cis-trans isomerase